MKRRTRRGLALGAAALGAVVLSAGPAAATHTHVLVLADGSCVILAENGAENEIDLSTGGVYLHNPNVDIAPTSGRNHPLHVLVHKGAAGDRVELQVMGDTNPAGGYDPCAGAGTGDYVNQQP
ncbi:MAG: hypothetical protein ACT4PX_02785 [Actinomycetota bacterium]